LPESYFILLFIVLVGFIIQGVLGYGFAIVAFPLLLSYGFDQPAFLTIALDFVVSLLFGIHYFQKEQLKTISRLLLYSFTGVLLGALVKWLTVSNKLLYLIPLGISVCLLLIANYGSKRLLNKISNPKLLGGLSGIMTNWSGIGGPPIVIYAMTNQEKYIDIKSLLAMYFMCLYVFTAVIMQFQEGMNYWTVPNIKLFCFGIMVILISKFLYNQVSNQLDGFLNNRSEWYKKVSFVVLLVICLIPIAKELIL